MLLVPRDLVISETAPMGRRLFLGIYIDGDHFDAESKVSAWNGAAWGWCCVLRFAPWKNGLSRRNADDDVALGLSGRDEGSASITGESGHLRRHHVVCWSVGVRRASSRCHCITRSTLCNCPAVIAFV